MSVLRVLVEDHSKFQDSLCDFTDWSVIRGNRTAAAAYTIPALGLDWGGCPLTFASSTTAEVVAITEALRALFQLPPCPAMILSDSKSAIQRIALPPLTDTATHRARDLASHLVNRGQKVMIQ